MGEWVNPRLVAEQQKQYLRDRFEGYMQQVDNGKLPQAIALTALREELEFNDVPTQESSTTA